MLRCSDKLSLRQAQVLCSPGWKQRGGMCLTLIPLIHGWLLSPSPRPPPRIRPPETYDVLLFGKSLPEVIKDLKSRLG